MPRAAVIILVAAAALARPLQVTEGNLPLRVVIKMNGQRMANCLFSTRPIPPHARQGTPLSDRFSDGDPMFARCYLPDRPGGNRPGELTDVFTLDGKPWWTQAYDQAVPADALERPIALGEVLRTLRPSLPKGFHRVEMVGQLKRGGRVVKLYHGEFHYVR